MMQDWLTARDVAERVSIPYPHLWTYLKRGTLPQADTHIGNKPLWSKSTIELWESQQEEKRHQKA